MFCIVISWDARKGITFNGQTIIRSPFYAADVVYQNALPVMFKQSRFSRLHLNVFDKAMKRKCDFTVPAYTNTAAASLLTFSRL